MIFVNDILGADSLTFSRNGNRHAVLITSADIKDILPTHSQIPDVNVSRHINSGQMSYMHRSVGIRQRASNKRSFKFVVHKYCILISFLIYLSERRLHRVRSIITRQVRLLYPAELFHYYLPEFLKFQLFSKQLLHFCLLFLAAGIIPAQRLDLYENLLFLRLHQC